MPCQFHFCKIPLSNRFKESVIPNMWLLISTGGYGVPAASSRAPSSRGNFLPSISMGRVLQQKHTWVRLRNEDKTHQWWEAYKIQKHQQCLWRNLQKIQLKRHGHTELCSDGGNKVMPSSQHNIHLIIHLTIHLVKTVDHHLHCSNSWAFLSNLNGLPDQVWNMEVFDIISHLHYCA